MRRRLLTFCSALSLLLCVAACVLWARSHRRTDAADLVVVGAVVPVWSSNGWLGAERAAGPAPWPFDTFWRVPYAAVAAALGLPPLAWRLRQSWLKRAERRKGTCRRCGYDLRATPARCPECGVASAANAA